MQINSYPIGDLHYYARNPRKNDEVVDRMVGSIKEFGFRIPVLIKTDGTIIDGHLRVKAAKKLGMTELPCIVADDLTENQIKAFRVLVNQSVSWADWDDELLKLEVADLDLADFDLDLLGFDKDKIEDLLFSPNEGQCDDDEVPEVDEKNVWVRPGDMFALGEHRLLCGDCTVKENVDRLMGGVKADMVFTDPPYGISYQSNMRTKTPKFDELNNDDKILEGWLPLALGASDGFVFVWTSWKVLGPWLHLFEKHTDMTNMIIWDKGGGGMGDLKHSLSTDYEMAMVSNRGKELSGKRIGSVWSSGKDSSSEYKHPTQKPVGLAEMAIGSCATGDVLDPFLGSGSTLIACEKTNRKCYGMEIDPYYCQVIIERFEKFTGKTHERI